MKKKMIMLAVIVVSLGAAAAWLILGIQARDREAGANRVLNAKIRYFDGECEMIPIQSCYYSNTLVKLVTKAGDVIYVGPNNVIIIDEEAGE